MQHRRAGLTDLPVRPGGRLLAGTSGFAYPAWSPRFYPDGLRPGDLLPHYAGRLAVCELNNTFYARPTPARIAAWTAAVPDAFRFVVKAQRGSTRRALGPDAADAVAWLTEPLPGFGSHLGGVLFRVPDDVVRDEPGLAGLLAAWPRTIPLVFEARHPSWQWDGVFEALRAADAILCTTDTDDAPVPDIRRTGPFLYLRLRRTGYTETDLDAWARRLVPFLDDGMDVLVVLRHDEDGTSALLAETFAARVARVRASG